MLGTGRQAIDKGYDEVVFQDVFDHVSLRETEAVDAKIIRKVLVCRDA